MNPTPEKEYFNQAYYKKFYINKKTRVRGEKTIPDLADFIFSYMRHLQLPIRSVLDAGCGLGEWKKAVMAHCPRAAYRGVEYSEYLCNRYGWQQGSVVDFKLSKEFDLVICQSVLQYLNNRDAKKAIANLARHCAGALYLEIITKKDWLENCDQRVTDDKIRLRTGSWYRTELGRYFRAVGGGLFLAKSAPVVLWELEGSEHLTSYTKTQ
jgi:chemotaxis methyl-accepting protein methylase